MVITAESFASKAATQPRIPQRTTFELNLRNEYTPFDTPSIEKVLAALRNTFPDDNCLTAYEQTGWGSGKVSVMVKNDIFDLQQYPVKLPRKNPVSGENELVSLYLTPEEKRFGHEPRKNGTLVTIVQSAIGTHSTIPNEVFTKEFEKFGKKE